MGRINRRIAWVLLAAALLIGSCRPAVETFVVFAPTEQDDHYANNAVSCWFNGRYYCMWQSSRSDEDAPDTHLVYSSSRDGRHWEAPRTLVSCTDSTFASAGGWLVAGDSLTAFVNLLDDIEEGGTAHYLVSADGMHWSAPQPVRMADGGAMDGILEQDPHVLPDGRIVGAAHFRPGLQARPVCTDDPSGHGGWRVGQLEMEQRGHQSRGIEPSLYLRPDGSLVMLFRDQASSFRKLSSVSRDRGETWSRPELTELTDARSKQCAGNLPDGRIYIIDNPAPAKDRTTLAIRWSEDGVSFSEPIPLRTPDDLPPRQFEGKYKTLGYSYPKAFYHKGALYVSYTENKERVVITRID